MFSFRNFLGNHKKFVDKIFWPFMVVIAVIILVEFFILGKFIANKFICSDEIWIDSKFNDEEVEDILWAFEEWDSATELTSFVYKGRHNDPEFFETDRIDGKSVIYKVEAPTKITKLYEDFYRKRHKTTLLGLGQRKNDTVILAYNLYKNYPVGSEIGRYYFKRLVLHELGHFLGLPDKDDPNLIMCKYIGGDPREALFVTEGDVAMFNGFRKRNVLVVPRLTKGR